MSDLKQDILSVLPGIHDRCDVDLMRSVRARLQRATVTEPPVQTETRCACKCGIVSHTVTEPEPTDADLRERLQAALPGGWSVYDSGGDTSFCTVKEDRVYLVGFPEYATLRKPGGIEACARALRVLAGVEQ